MSESIKVSEIFPVTAKKLYTSWLDSKEHSAFTGTKAEIFPRVGEHYHAGNGYIHGSIISLQPYGRMVLSWRSTDFPDGVRDSKLEVLFEKSEKGTRVTIIHSELPDGQGKMYEKGWKDHYFKPMKKYFRNHK
jgi:activator of HSP90 ATPase